MLSALILGSSSASALVLAPVRAPAVRARTIMQFDEEGSMVKGIEEGGQSWEEVRAACALPPFEGTANSKPTRGVPSVCRWRRSACAGRREAGEARTSCSCGDSELRLAAAAQAVVDEMTAKAVGKGMTDLDFDITCQSMMDTACDFNIMPTMNTFEDFFLGLTSDSHPAFKLTSAFEGRMDRRGGAPLEVSIKVRPRQMS